MLPYEKIKQARLRAGLTDSEVAQRAGLSIHEYGDIEQHADELHKFLELARVRKLAAVLDLNVLDLLNLAEDRGDPNFRGLARNDVVRRRMTDLKMSTSELANRIGYEERIVEGVTSDPDFIETLTLDTISDMATALQMDLTDLLRR